MLGGSGAVISVMALASAQVLVGGATEATVIARVGEAIVTAIGSCESYRDALADPLLITRQVIQRGLDSQTAFEIVSIDIAGDPHSSIFDADCTSVIGDNLVMVR